MYCQKRCSILFFVLATLAISPPASLADNRKMSGKTYYKAQTATRYKTTATTTREKPVAHYKGEKTSAAPKVFPSTTKPLLAPEPTPSALKEGPYLGVSGGYDSYKVHENIPLNGGNTTSTYNASINGTGLIGALLAGYGHYFNSALYVGSEVFVNISAVYQNANITISNSSDTISYNSKFIVTTGYGLSFLPGVKLNDRGLFFLRLGYHVARLRGQENRIVNGGSPIVNDTSSWSGGFGYGLGFEESMLENLSLRGEYIHIDYRTFNASTSSGTQYSPSDNQFMLSLIYHL